MKRTLAALLTLALVAAPVVAFADIHVPPGAQNDRTRKLSRGLSNILFGVTEIPSTFTRVNRYDGSTEAFSYGVIEGVRRTVVRMGFGVYEVVTFPAATYKDGYRQPYRDIRLDPFKGYSEFPPVIGVESHSQSNRTQPF